MTMEIIDGKTRVRCCRCRRSFALIASTEPEKVARGLTVLRWRPAPEGGNLWICRRCIEGDGRGPKDLAAKAPLPTNHDRKPIVHVPEFEEIGR